MTSSFELTSTILLDEINNLYLKNRVDTTLPLKIKEDRKDDATVRGHFRRWYLTFFKLREVIKNSKRENILDLGTNSAYHPELYDIFPHSDYYYVSGKNKKLGRETWYNIDLEKDLLPLEDSSVDVVLLLEVLEHFKHDPMFCLLEINRLLKQDGIFLLTTPNIVSWSQSIRTLEKCSPYHYGCYHKTPDSRGHVREYTPNEVARLLIAAGFKPEVTTINSYYEKEGPLCMDFLKQFGFSTVNRGDTILAVAQKDSSAAINRYPQQFYV